MEWVNLLRDRLRPDINLRDISRWRDMDNKNPPRVLKLGGSCLERIGILRSRVRVVRCSHIPRWHNVDRTYPSLFRLLGGYRVEWVGILRSRSRA